MLKKIKEWLEVKNSKNKVGRPKLAQKELKKSVKIEIALAFVLCATLVLSGTSALTGKSPLELLGLNGQNKFKGDVAVDYNSPTLTYSSKTKNINISEFIKNMQITYTFANYSDSQTDCPKIIDKDKSIAGVQNPTYQKKMQNFFIDGTTVYFSFPIRSAIHEKEIDSNNCTATECIACKTTKGEQSTLFKSQVKTAVIIKKDINDTNPKTKNLATEVVAINPDGGHGQTFDIVKESDINYFYSAANVKSDTSQYISGENGYLFATHSGVSKLEIPNTAKTISNFSTKRNFSTFTFPEISLDVNYVAIKNSNKLYIYQKNSFFSNNAVLASTTLSTGSSQGSDISNPYFYHYYGKIDGDANIDVYYFDSTKKTIKKTYFMTIPIKYLRNKIINNLFLENILDKGSLSSFAKPDTDSTKNELNTLYIYNIEAEGIKYIGGKIYFGIIYNTSIFKEIVNSNNEKTIKHYKQNYNNIYSIDIDEARDTIHFLATQTTTSFGKFNVVKVTNKNCYNITKPAGVSNNWRVHLFHKNTNSGSFVLHDNYDYLTAQTVKVCFTKHYNKETFRILVKATDKAGSDSVLTSPSYTTWQPTGWSYNSDIGWSSKDYNIIW